MIVVRSGEHKGAGFSGAKLTPDQHAELKRRIDIQARHFVAAIVRGRGMTVDKANELADGRVFIGREAIAAGLADRVGTVEDVIGEAAQRSKLFEIENLTGKVAAKKYAELLRIETEKEYGQAERARYQLDDRYPKLATAARNYKPTTEL